MLLAGGVGWLVVWAGWLAGMGCWLAGMEFVCCGDAIS